MSSELQNHGETSMELQKGPRKPGNQKMTLEQYIDFFNDDKQLVLTVNVLRQIILMHRFKLIQRVPKDELMDAVRSIDLMKPARSTINGENISSCAFITLHDAIKDLSILKWQECCITSLQTLNSVDHDNLTTTTTTVASTCSNKSKSKCNSKKTSSAAAASVVTDHSAKSPTLEQLEMEPRLSEVDCDTSSAIVVFPAPDGGGTENQSITRKRKRKTISASMAS